MWQRMKKFFWSLPPIFRSLVLALVLITCLLVEAIIMLLVKKLVGEEGMLIAFGVTTVLLLSIGVSKVLGPAE